MPVDIVQRVDFESTVDANTVTVPWDTKPREGNALVVFYNGDGGPIVEDFQNAGWSEARNADDITGAYIFDKLAGADEATSVTIPLSGSVSHEVSIFELTSTADDPRDVTASNTSGGSFPTTQSSGNTSPEFSGMAQADERVFVCYTRNGAGFTVTALAAGLDPVVTLVGQGTHPTTMVIATAELDVQETSLEYVSTISGGSLEPGGMLVTYKARLAGPVARSLRQQYEQAPNALDVAITNTGTGSLSWTATPSDGWIDPTPDSGTAPSTMTVKASAQGLVPDVYDGDVSIAGAGATNTPLSLPVTLTVTPEPVPVSAALYQPFRVGGAVVHVAEGDAWVGDEPQTAEDDAWAIRTTHRAEEGHWA